MATQQCSICNESKSTLEFRSNPRFGIRTECRECEKKWLRCSRCKTVKSHEEFPPCKRMKTGRHSMCNDCHTERVMTKYRGSEEQRQKSKQQSQSPRAKAWRKQYWKDNKDKPGRKAKRNEYMRWLYHSDPIHRMKIKARGLVAHLLDEGKLTKPNVCEQCGCASDELEGHHYAGYWPRATWRMVKWYCPECHLKADADQTTEKLFMGTGLPEFEELEFRLKLVESSLGINQDDLLKAAIECTGEDELMVLLNTIFWLVNNGKLKLDSQ